MRVKALSLLYSGRSLSDVSRETGVQRATLRAWVETGVLPKQSSSACWVCTKVACPSPTSYAALLGFYLGDGCISRSRSVYSLRVSCDRIYPGIIDDVSNLIRAVVDGATVGRVNVPGAVVVNSYWKHWPCVFPQHGPGRKHLRKLELEDWQQEIVSEHPGEFLRGLFHSDGCRVNNWARRPVAEQLKRYRAGLPILGRRERSPAECIARRSREGDAKHRRVGENAARCPPGDAQQAMG